MEMVRYSYTEEDLFESFAEAIYDSELKYCCNDLYKTGIDDEADMSMAILKSMQVLGHAGLLPRHHFKHIFVTNINEGNIYSDWRMSKMAFLLVLMHANGNNPLLNKWKIEMVKLLK